MRSRGGVTPPPAGFPASFLTGLALDTVLTGKYLSLMLLTSNILWAACPELGSQARNLKMKNLLFVTSSLFGQESKSTRIASEFVSSWKAANGPARIIHRVLGSVPHLTADHFGAWMTAPGERSERQHTIAAESDPLIEEIEAADVIVIAAPMYNFSIPSTLKAWIDHITRAGRTFRYTAEGTVEGLLKNKKVFVVTARGGVYTGDSPAKPY